MEKGHVKVKEFNINTILTVFEVPYGKISPAVAS